ncbi:MAG TPA: M14 family zinc carboxypeptidase, partial [Opitutaceae bacterium]|nr:M14 family zinc carboxypeptidase [Opitutaceae bacterium]
MFARPLLLALILTGLPAAAFARGQPVEHYLHGAADYAATVPTPEAFFGFPMGEWHLSSHQLDAYLRAVAAAAPDRVRLEVIGHSHERKPLHLLTITAPKNHARLDEVRREHLARWSASPPRARDDDAPVIV